MATETELRHGIGYWNPTGAPFFFSGAATFTLLTAGTRSKIGLAFTFLIEIISKWKSPGRHGRKESGESKFCNLSKVLLLSSKCIKSIFEHDVAFIWPYNLKLDLKSLVVLDSLKKKLFIASGYKFQWRYMVIARLQSIESLVSRAQCTEVTAHSKLSTWAVAGGSRVDHVLWNRHRGWESTNRSTTSCASACWIQLPWQQMSPSALLHLFNALKNTVLWLEAFVI